MFETTGSILISFLEQQYVLFSLPEKYFSCNTNALVRGKLYKSTPAHKKTYRCSKKRINNLRHNRHLPFSLPQTRMFVDPATVEAFVGNKWKIIP